MGIIGTLEVLVQANTRQFSKQIKTAKKNVGDFAKSMKGMLAAAGIGAGVGFGVKLAAEIEVASKQFKVLTKDANVARKTLADLRRFGTREGVLFDDKQIRTAAQRLLGYGVAQDKVLSRMKQLGDAASGTGSNIADLAEIFGRVRQSGIAMNEDLERLNDRGISISRMLADRFAEGNMLALKKMASQGQVTFDMFSKAFDDLTTGAGQFTDASKEMADTTLGRLRRFQKEMSQIALSIGESLLKNLDTEKLSKAAMTFANTLTGVVAPAMERIAALISDALAKWEKFSKKTGVEGAVPIPGVGVAVKLKKPQPILPRVPNISAFNPRGMMMQGMVGSQLAGERFRRQEGRIAATERVGAAQARATGGALLSQTVNAFRGLLTGIEQQRQRMGAMARGQALRNQILQRRSIMGALQPRAVGGMLGGLSNMIGGGIASIPGMFQGAGGATAFQSNTAVQQGSIEAARLEERRMFDVAVEAQRQRQEDRDNNRNTILSTISQTLLSMLNGGGRGENDRGNNNRNMP